MTDDNNRQARHRNPALDCAFQIGEWQVDPALNLIVDRQTDEQRHLEPRLMKLLCFLAANQGAVVSRDELVALLWPRVIVNENSLTRAISELRKQLDAPATPARQAIQTIPKRGYRLSVPILQTRGQSPALDNEQFQAPVNPDADAIAAPISRFQTRTPRTSTAVAMLATPGRLVASGIAASLCLLLVLGISTRPSAPAATGVLASFSDEVIFSADEVSGSRFNLRATGLTDLTPGGFEQPVVSPDRQRFAFIQRDLSASSIYLAKMNADHEPVEVFSAPYRLSNLTWSPVGNALLFARQNELAPAVMFPGTAGDSELMRLDLDSGTVTRLVENPAPAVDSSAPESNLTYFDALDTHLDKLLDGPRSRESSPGWEPDRQSAAQPATVPARPSPRVTPA
jgi:DNA-binding winged helix-turn-helix (wHTH) protein